MRLKRISIINFKNIAEARLDFSPDINCFLGNNGMGKTNLLDAIHYLSLARSFSGLNDSALIRRGTDFMMLRGEYDRHGIDEEISAGVIAGKRKSFKRKGKEYQRLSDHIGLFPLVLVAPSDTDLINGTGEERRRLMDMVISQSDPVYLDHLIRYSRSLQQRNKMLRDHVADHNLYAAVEMAMDFSADYLAKSRRRWVEELTPIFTELYGAIAGDGEAPALRYQTHLDDPTQSLAELFERTRQRDTMTGHTTVGPHRDDLELTLNELPVRRAASQGQCKSFTVAMRLAQYDFLRRSAGVAPLLLLDDIFDKLDSRRVERIISIVRSGNRFGQIFITDTNRDHLDSIMEIAGGDYRIWETVNGSFKDGLSSNTPDTTK
ncbi:MAG: DNA replication/repair protein RecF [Muribaculaceae bacterium]|nr:DNA replication/repair protein RecF [Muribaculaceae bacterium]